MQCQILWKQIAEDLMLEKEDLSALVYDQEFDPQDIFEKEELEQWAFNHNFVYSENKDN